MRRPTLAALVLIAAWGTAQARDFAVYPIARPRLVQGVQVAVIYFQPIDLEGAMMHPADDADLHLEADITAAKGDPDGYAEGDWRPYLAVSFRLTRPDTGQTLAGQLMPLVSYGKGSIGKPHYGDNLKLFGPGRYRLDLTVAPPAGQAIGGSSEPFTLHYDFVYAGIGKRGAY